MKVSDSVKELTISVALTEALVSESGKWHLKEILGHSSRGMFDCSISFLCLKSNLRISKNDLAKRRFLDGARDWGC